MEPSKTEVPSVREGIESLTDGQAVNKLLGQGQRSRGRRPGRRNKPNKTGRNDSTARFVRLEHWILNHEAVRALRSEHRDVIVALTLRHNGVNNGNISFSVRECKAYLHSGMDKARKILEALEQLHFITCTAEGRLGIEGRGVARRWRLNWVGDEQGVATRGFAKLRGREVKQYLNDQAKRWNTPRAFREGGRKTESRT